MEFDEVPVEVCVDIGVDGPVNLFALLDQAAQRFPDRGAVCHGGRRRCTWRELRYLAMDQLPKSSYGKVLKRELRRQLV
jgi:fatty-acyl-CoA synthase